MTAAQLRAILRKYGYGLTMREAASGFAAVAAAFRRSNP
jgi:N-acetyl-anhydromuramyl-L-alanine amidase AmpD